MEIRNLSFGYGKTPVLKNVTASFEKGKITTILGPNGCGKSTVFHLMTKNLKPSGGGVYLEGRDISDIALKAFARRVAIVHQYNTAPSDATVGTLVSYGRTPYLSFGRQKNKEDDRIIDWAMEMTNVYRYKDRAISRLSGGQRQRVWIAMALAQKTDTLLLDEPTTYLDVRYQIQILNLIAKLNRECGITIAMVLHDINQAAGFSDRIIGLREGEIVAWGTAEDMMNCDVLRKIFDVNLKVVENGDRKYVFC